MNTASVKPEYYYKFHIDMTMYNTINSYYTDDFSISKTESYIETIYIDDMFWYKFITSKTRK